MGEGGLERIFLYGTLRRGGSRDVLVFYTGARFVFPARVRGVLADFEVYPGLRLVPDAGWVIGELFDVDATTLAGLDDWEGIDPAAPDVGEYRRVRATVEGKNGATEECWVYEVSLEKSAGRPIIPSGDWIAHQAART